MNPRFIEQMGWRMGEVYAAVTDQILINLARHFPFIAEGAKPGGAWDYQVRKLAELGQVTRETEAIILSSMKGGDAALAELLEETIRQSLKPIEKPLRNAANKGLLLGGGFLPPEVSPQMTQTFKAYYLQAADKMNLVNTVMLQSTQAAYQRTVTDITSRMLIAEKINVTQEILDTETGKVVAGVSSMNEAIRGGVRRMVDNGITGFVDRGGHHWSPEAYITMDMRTTLANTGRAAIFEEMERFGDDLYSVSWHDGARPLCYPWQGKVISRSDWSGEVEDLDGEKVHVYAQSETSYGEAAGLFGINCGHYAIPFIPGYSKARQPEQNEEQNAKEYEESQKQRALERKLREEKRDLEVLKAQGASEDEIKAQRQKVKTARNNLDDFCDETGRARRSSRESTPIKASFPEPEGLKTPTNNGMINAPIESRNRGDGNPSAVAYLGRPLNNRQQMILDQLPDYGSRYIVNKKDVSMRDLSAMTASTGDEFAMFTKGGSRLIIRGDSGSTPVTVDEARKLKAEGYKWSGHTHPGTTRNVLQPSPGDHAVLNAFEQDTSVITNSAGEYDIMWSDE